MSQQLAVDDAQLRDEFTYRDGVGYVATRALARVLGVAESSIRRGAALKTSKLARSLAAAGFSGAALAEWPDAACAVIAEYYAFDAQQTSDQARAFLKLTSAIGVRTWVREKCKGLDGDYVKARIESKRVRHPFTQTLQDHGCEGRDMAIITDNNNVLVTGKRAKEIVATRAPGAAKKLSGRQLMSTAELVMTTVLEAAQTAQVKMLVPAGGNQCLAVCSATGTAVMQLMTQPLNVLGVATVSRAPSPVNSSAYRVVTAADF